MCRFKDFFVLLANKLSVSIIILFALLISISSISAQAATTYSPFKQRLLGYRIHAQGYPTIYSSASEACQADPINVPTATSYLSFLYTMPYYEGFYCISQRYENGMPAGTPSASLWIMPAYENVCQSPFVPVQGQCSFTPPKPPSSSCPSNTPYPIEIATGKKILNEQNYRGNFARPLELTLHYNSVKPSATITFLPNALTSVPVSLGGGVTSRNTNAELVCEPRADDPEYATLCPAQNSAFDKARTAAPGMGWSHNGHRGVVTLPGGLSAVVYLADGTGYLFELKNSVWTPTLAVAGKLEKLLDGSGALSGWKYTNRSDDIEVYDSLGQLKSVTGRNGVSQTYTYDTLGRINTLTDSFGHKITLGYDASNRLSTMTDPAGQVDRYAYDANNNLTSLTYADNTVKTYLYEDARFPNALTAVIDEKGNRYMNYHYDDQGRAVSEEHSGNINRHQLVFGSDGKSTTVIDPLGTARTMMFTDILGALRLTSQTQPSGSGCEASSSSVTYDANGNTATRKNFNGTMTTYTYEPVRNLEIKRVEASGTVTARTITTSWHASYRTPVQVNEPLLKTIYTHDASGNVLTKTLQATTDLDGSQGAAATVVGGVRTWTTTYNNRGQVLTTTGPRTDAVDRTTYTYDSQGNVATITNALGHVTQYLAYDPNGRPLDIIKPDGARLTLTYDLRGRLLTSSVNGNQTSLTYDAAGNLTKVTSPNGAEINNTYDAAHRLIAVSDKLGNRMEYTLDNVGNKTNIVIRDTSNSLRFQQQKVYDALSRLKQVIDTKSQQTTYLYDANGNPTGEVDAKSQTTSNSFDALDQLKLTTDALNGKTDYSYNAQGQVTQVKDPKGNATTYVYNAFGDVISQTSPDTGVTTFTYDAAGNRTSAKDARAIVVNYTYDALNRLLTVRYPAASGESVNYTYDDVSNGSYGIGRLTGIVSTGAGLTYRYNHLGMISQKIVLLNGITTMTQYGYDLAGNLSSITYPSGRLVTYVRNSAGQVDSITTKSTPTASVQTLVSNLGYLPFGPASSYTFGNGLSHNASYDNDYRLTGIQVGGILNRAYLYDPVDNITGITNSLASNKSQTFAYDALNRLTSANGIYGALGYTYDAVGNRTSQSSNNGTSVVNDTYIYPTTSNRLGSINQTTGGVASGTRSFTYDAAGNRIQGTAENGTVQNFTFNKANRMTTAKNVSTTVGTYSYNALGQRVSKAAGSVKELYHYDEAGQLIAVTNYTGKTLREYVYHGNQLTAFVAVKHPTIATISLAAAQATLQNAVLSKVQTGYTASTGYIQYNGEGQAAWPVTILSPANYNFNVRYSLATTNRPLAVLVDGVQKATLNFTTTATWNTWATGTVALNLTAGNHTITLKTIGSGGPNIDRASVIPASGQTGTPVPTTYYVHTDHLGSPQIVTAQNQTVAWMADYQPFGKLQPGQTNSIELYSRFPGQSLDSETGLYYNYFRDYDPSIGRYIESDPIGILRDYSDPHLRLDLELGVIEEGDFAGENLNHLYGYVGQNPLMWYDPYGLAEHTQNARPSTKAKHEKANARRDKDRGGEKGDKSRDAPRNRPPGFKGPWPPKAPFSPWFWIPDELLTPCAIHGKFSVECHMSKCPDA